MDEFRMYEHLRHVAPQFYFERREGPDFEITDVMNSSFPDYLSIKIYIPIE